jgi:acetyl-CoA synthetase
MLERFLKKTRFDSFDDFMQHYEVCVPEHFNFAYDVVDAWAKEDADKRAMLWTISGKIKHFEIRQKR